MKTEKKSCLAGFLTVFIVIALCLSTSLTFAQYVTQQTANITFSSSGTAYVDQSETVGGISLSIAGTVGASGSVSTGTYLANPQPGATIPPNVDLTNFVSVSFNIDPSDFTGAVITVSYSASDVAGISPPYSLYKYSSATNSYVQLNSIDDTSANTISAQLTSISDPLLAIGGAPAPTTQPVSSGVPAWIWAVIVVIVIVVVLVAFIFIRRRKVTFKVIPADSDGYDYYT